MTKERELLRRVIDCLKHSYRPIDRDILIEDVEAHLAAEEGKQEEEPVDGSKMEHTTLTDTDILYWAHRLASRYMHESPFPYWFTAQHLLDFAKRIHPSPQAEQRKPLSEEEIKRGPSVYTKDYTRNQAFEAGVRFAEKHHGIGGDDE